MDESKHHTQGKDTTAEMVAKEDKLKAILKGYKKVAVTYSGGIDSTYLLQVANQTLGKANVIAAVVNSELFSDEEFDHAIDIANELGARVIGLDMSELSEPNIVANTPKSWYYSKRLLYSTIKQEVAKMDDYVVVDGMNMNDQGDFRPGLRARDDEHVLSPLQEAGLYKEEIRLLAKRAGVSNWNQVASCSVASRFPYGQKITKKGVDQVFKAEAYLKDLGFDKVRVRIHGDLARIEVSSDKIPLVLEKKEAIEKTLEGFGFHYVSLDLKGYQYGRMNAVLDEKTKNKIMKK